MMKNRNGTENEPVMDLIRQQNHSPVGLKVCPGNWRLPEPGRTPVNIRRMTPG